MTIPANSSSSDRHRRIRRRSRAIYIGVVPFALMALLVWLWARLFVCWSSGLGPFGMLLCRASSLAAPLVVIGAVVLLIVTVYDLHVIGGETAELSAGRTARMRAGYRTLDDEYKAFVRWAWSFVLVAMVVIGLVIALSPLNLHLFG